MRGLAFFVLVALTLAGPTRLSGQDPAAVTTPPSDSQIAGWLQSSEPREVAWGAVYALRRGDNSFLPDLLALAEHWEPIRSEVADMSQPQPAITPEQRELETAMAAVLDGVIQMKGAVPAEALGNLAGEFPAQVIVLLSRMRPVEAQAVLLDLYSHPREPYGSAERAAAALLALHPPAAFSASLLKATTIRTEVFVSLPEDMSIGIGRSGCRGGSGLEPFKPGWPQVGMYELADDDKDTHGQPFLVAAGIRPIFAVRTVARAWCFACHGLTPLDDEVRLDLLSQMLGANSREGESKTFKSTNLKVSNDQDYAIKLAQYIESEERSFVRLKDELARPGLLSPAERADDAILPTLRIHVNDARSVKEFPLTPISLPQPNVQWSTEPW